MPKLGNKIGTIGARTIKERCVIFGCTAKTYALWLCRDHYQQALFYGTAIPVVPMRCHVPTCTEVYGLKNGMSAVNLCPKHRNLKRYWDRQDVHLTPDEIAMIRKGIANRGDRNPNWKGGKFPYLNFRDYQKTRLELLKTHGWKCQKCGQPAKTVKHMNNNPTDHHLSNLRVLCTGCLAYAPKNPPCDYQTKFKKRYGISIRELAITHKATEGKIRYWMTNHGWKPGQPPPKTNRWDPEREAARRAFGVCAGTLYVWRKKYGWQPGQPRPAVRRGRPRRVT